MVVLKKKLFETYMENTQLINNRQLINKIALRKFDLTNHDRKIYSNSRELEADSEECVIVNDSFPYVCATTKLIVIVNDSFSLCLCHDQTHCHFRQQEKFVKATLVKLHYIHIHRQP